MNRGEYGSSKTKSLKCLKWHIFAVSKVIFFISVPDSMIFFAKVVVLNAT